MFRTKNSNAVKSSLSKVASAQAERAEEESLKAKLKGKKNLSTVEKDELLMAVAKRLGLLE